MAYRIKKTMTSHWLIPNGDVGYYSDWMGSKWTSRTSEATEWDANTTPNGLVADSGHTTYQGTVEEV